MVTSPSQKKGRKENVPQWISLVAGGTAGAIEAAATVR